MTLEIDGESMLIISPEIKLAPALWNEEGRDEGWGTFINFLIETPGKFMEDEKSLLNATPYHYPNEFMQIC